MMTARESFFGNVVMGESFTFLEYYDNDIEKLLNNEKPQKTFKKTGSSLSNEDNAICTDSSDNIGIGVTMKIASNHGVIVL